MSLPFTPDELNDAVRNGRVTRRPHPTLPLDIYNYSPEVQYSNQWDDVTLNCRGLILDRDYNIVARPWKKFFNLGQVNLPIQFDTPVEVMDKADGSLGILYFADDRFAIATRGSFDSEQARHATKLLDEKYGDFLVDRMGQWWLQTHTFLFEIIYPSNRIVLDYDGMDDLILLGAVENKTGYYVGPGVASAAIAWPGPVVETFKFNTISDALANMGRKNAEGYVIRSHNFMVKVKEPDYIDLHRLVTNASPKTAWEQLRAGRSREEVISAFPDEFHSYIEGMVDPLIDNFEKRFVEIMERFSQVTSDHFRQFGGSEFDRGRFARYIRDEKDKRYFFLLLDNKPVRDVLWGELRPKESSVEAAEKR